MNKIILFGLGAVMYLGANAQQLTFNSQYMLNQFLINPAAAGTQSKLNIATSFRQQWAGFKEAPKTQMLSANALLNGNMGVGGIVYNDVTGPLQKIGFNGSYSYHLKMGDKSKLALGVSLMLTQHVLDGSSFVLDDEVDATLNTTQKSFNPDASFGVQYFGSNYYVGIAVPQLIENKYKFGDILSESNKEVRHYYFSGGYTFELNEDLKVEPSVLLKYAVATPFQFDINARMLYKDNLWLGFSYRDQESLVALLGMKRDQFVIGYSYDYTLSNIRKYSAGTHELYLAFEIPSDFIGVTKRKKGRSSLH